MQKKMTTVVTVRSALLGAAGAVLMQFGIRLPIFPGFLSLDVGNLPALIGAVTTGPLTGLLAMLVKNLLDPLIFGTNTGGVGNFANFVMGAALVVPLGLIFKYRRDTLGYIAGSAAGIICTAIAAAIMNYFVLLPLFTRLFMPMETILAMAYAVNSNVTSVPRLIVFAIIPFNLLKGFVVVVLGFAIYRSLKPIFTKLSTMHMG